MKSIRRAALAALLVAATAFPVMAQATRTWVSGVGDDANPCSRTAPCKTWAGAISKTATKGEINVLDPGGFGALTITKSITVDGRNFEASALAAGTNGIIINPTVETTATVVLRNIQINGAGNGLNGIRILNGGTVRIENVTIWNFTQRGIDIQVPNPIRVSILNSSVHDVTGHGIAAATGNVKIEIANTSVIGTGGHGIWVGFGNTGAIDHCTVSENAGDGLVVNGANTKVTLSNSLVTRNGSNGVEAGTGAGDSTGAVVGLFGNVITANTNGVKVTSGSGVTVETHGNNAIRRNTTADITGGGSLTSVGVQ
jgi:hypothetical protein